MLNILKKIQKKISSKIDYSNENEKFQSSNKSKQNKEIIVTTNDYVIRNIVNIYTAKAKIKFAKPKTYVGNRNYYDSAGAKVKAKNKLFNNNKKIIDPYTQNELFLTKKEAKLKYGTRWTEHLAESDHIKPLEKIAKETQNNVWNTTNDIKNAANSPNNINVVSRKFNNAKRSRTNEEFVKDDIYLNDKGINLTQEAKQKAIKDGKTAELLINKELRNSSIKNMLSTGHEAGMNGLKNTAITSVTISGINNIVDVIKGQKTSQEAIKDIIVTSGTTAATGYVMSSGLTVVTHSFSKSSSPLIKKLVNSNVPSQVITAIMVTGQSLSKWASGEITTQECILEISEKGLNTITIGYSMAVGQSLIPIPIIGGAIGALIGSALTSNLYQNSINKLRNKQLEHEERLRIIAECEKAIEQEKAFRAELEIYLSNYLKEYRNFFEDTLMSISIAFQNGNADEIIKNSNKITKKLGGKVYYETIEEFKDFLDDESIDIL